MAPKTNSSDRIKWAEADPDILDRVIEMAWEDRTPFEAIEAQFGLAERDVIDIMRRNMKPSSFRRWRKRVTGRATKHRLVRGFTVGTHKCDRQRHISGNRYRK